MTKMTIKEIIEARIALIEQQMQMLRMGGVENLTTEYMDLEAELEDAFYQLDALPVTAMDLKRIKGQEIIKNRFKVKRFGANYVQIIGFHYGDEEEKLIGTAAEGAKWINQYLGLVTK